MTIENTKQQFTSTTADFSLKSLLDSYKDSTSISINCHHVGTIQEFDPSTQTATATINYTKTFFQFDKQKNSNVPVQIEYPVLMSCPVICLGGGSASLTFPIQSGDECLILFNDRSIDNWFQSGANNPLNSPRLHSISDGIILVGLRSSQKVLANYDTSRAVLKNGGAMVGVGPTKIKISNNSVDLNTVLQSLISAIEAITVGSTPIDNAASFPPIATQLGNLLE